MSEVKFTFGMIVLNGEPFTRYNLRGLYPHAHQIIVVEGASPSATAICGPDGHSTDGTLDVLRDFIQNEDLENKVTLVTAEDEGHLDGFWPGEKDEQSRAYASRASGNYLWQVDSDEFYKPEDIEAVRAMLAADSEIEAVSFPMLTFWGSLDVITDSWYLRRGANTYHRLFKWQPGYRYHTHRPPTVVNAAGVDLRRLKWVSRPQLLEKGIYLYHYSLLFPRQVYEKCAYYENSAAARREGSLRWVEEDFLRLRRPFRTHNVFEYPGWLEHCALTPPPEAARMWADLAAGRLKEPIRPMEDAYRLLASPWYRLGVRLLILLEPLERPFSRNLRAGMRRLKRLARRLLGKHP